MPPEVGPLGTVTTHSITCIPSTLIWKYVGLQHTLGYIVTKIEKADELAKQGTTCDVVLTCQYHNHASKIELTAKLIDSTKKTGPPKPKAHHDDTTNELIVQDDQLIKLAANIGFSHRLKCPFDECCSITIRAKIVDLRPSLHAILGAKVF